MPPPGAAAAVLPAALAPHRDAPIHVVGIASVEGAEMARFCLAAGCPRVVGHDLAPESGPESVAAAFERAHAGLPVPLRRARWRALLEGVWSWRLGDRYLEGIDEAAVVVPTQAWFLHPANRPLAAWRDAGRPLYSLAQAYLDCASGPVVGVSGSHGKSTTAALIAALAARTPAVEAVRLAGNDRHHLPCLVEAAAGGPADLLVVEISNRQLLQMETAPAVACLTNLTPNHLDEHGGFAAYAAAKARLFALPGNRVAVRNGDDPVSLARCPVAPGARELRFARELAGLAGRDGAADDGDAVVVRRSGRMAERLPVAWLALRGAHNRANIRAAVATVAALGPLPAAAADALRTFAPLRHRTQLVWQQDGVDFVDDLNSTTPQSTVAAIQACGRPVVLICGGDDKGLDVGPLAATVPDPVRRVVLLPGPGSERIARALEAAGAAAHIERAPTLDEAVALAAAAASLGSTVLFSPACPGVFHAFYGPDPGGRGFRAAVRALRPPATSPPRRRARA